MNTNQDNKAESKSIKQKANYTTPVFHDYPHLRSGQSGESQKDEIIEEASPLENINIDQGEEVDYNVEDDFYYEENDPMMNTYTKLKQKLIGFQNKINDEN